MLKGGQRGRTWVNMQNEIEVFIGDQQCFNFKKLEEFGRSENIAGTLMVCYVFILDTSRVSITNETACHEI